MRNIIVSLSISFLIACGKANALPMDNLSFENSLTGWYGEGNITTSTNMYSLLGKQYSATDGQFFVVLDSSGTFNTNDFDGTEGSILTTYVELSAGDKLSFDWAFLTEDWMPYNDFSLFTADKSYLLSDVATVGSFGSSGWNNFTWAAEEAYNGNISFLVSNSVDTAVSSILLVDNVQQSKIPEPDIPFLLAIGVIGIYFSKRKISPPICG